MRTTFRAGFTLVESMVAMVVFVAVVGMLFAAVRTGQETVASGERLSDETEWSSRVARRIQDDLQEANIDHVDTGFRYHDSSNAALDQFANHTWEMIPRLSQCLSGTCPYNRRSEQGALADKEPEIYAGRSYAKWGSNETVYLYGRVSKGLKYALCPLHASFAAQGADLDAMMFWSPRDETGAFVTAEASEAEQLEGTALAADWQSIVFYYPYYDGQVDDLQLRRQVVYRRDLLTGDVPGTAYSSFYAGSSGWTDWDANSPAGVPTLVDLFDLGTDGALDGLPDGNVPLTPAASDCNQDTFQGYSYAGAQPNVVDGYLYVYKALTSVPGMWHSNYLYLDRRTGGVQWYVYFSRGATWWYHYSVFDRPPEIVARGLVDCDFSTKVSNPVTAQNPHGVASATSVRVTLLFSGGVDAAGEVRNVEHALTFEVSPRN